MMRHILWILLCMLVAASVEAQDLNFNDLKRPGKPLVKSYTIQGVGSEGNRYIRNFNEVDSSRVSVKEASRSASSSGVSASTSTSTSTSSKNVSEPNGNFECKFVCSKFVSLVSSDTSPEQKIKVSARDVHSAEDIGLANAKQWCKNIGYDSLKSRWGDGYIKCR